MCFSVDHSEKGLPKECSKNVHFLPPFAIFVSESEAVDGKSGDILINCKICSVLNFSLTKLKDGLKNEENRKNISLSSFRYKKN